MSTLVFFITFYLHCFNLNNPIRHRVCICYMLWQQYYIVYVLPSEKVFEVQNPPEDGVITHRNMWG
jgi:hypothetical protein